MPPLFDDPRQATSPHARQILQILDAGGYTAPSGRWVATGEAQTSAENGTRLVTPAELERLRAQDAPGGPPPPVRVVDATTQDAAQALATRAEVAILSFASARSPGGGFLGGAVAQEEELCRCSGLYRALLTQPVYYQTHRADRSLLYSDHLIYSPAVPFFRTRSADPLLEEPFLASVITAPAPNAGALQRHGQDTSTLEPTFERRWANVLAACQDRGHRAIVLGAWGCGAFRNDPHLVARAARRALAAPRFHGAFAEVVFAIPDGGRGRANFAAFREVLGDAG